MPRDSKQLVAYSEQATKGENGVRNTSFGDVQHQVHDFPYMLAGFVDHLFTGELVCCDQSGQTVGARYYSIPVGKTFAHDAPPKVIGFENTRNYRAPL